MFVAFPNCPSDQAAEVMKLFFEHVIFKGVLDSPQSRNTPIALPFDAVVARNPKGSLCRIFPTSIHAIQLCIAELVAKDERYV